MRFSIISGQTTKVSVKPSSKLGIDCSVKKKQNRHCLMIGPASWFVYSRQRRVVLCRASVCPSVNFSCPLCNSDTVQDIFLKLGINVNNHQIICRKQQTDTPSIFLRNNAPLKIFL